jgi:hypothetical protein
MPFSLGSYLIGVGTVVGALVFGFGGGVVLTHTAMKENPPGQTRVERLARAEPEAPAAQPAPAVQVTPVPNQAANQAAVAPNQVTAPEQDHPASVAVIKQDAAPVERPAAIPPDSVPAAQTAALKPDAARQPEPETPRPMKQATREPQPPKQVEQTERTDVKHVESRDTDHSAERAGRYATSRMRQRRFVVQEEPAQEVVVSKPPEPQHFDLFGGLFGRPADASE